MCAPVPLKRLLLEALRLRESRQPANALQCWLDWQGLSEPISTLAQMVESTQPGQPTFGPPGEASPWPMEEQLILALGMATTDPEQLTDSLSTWLSQADAARAECLLIEISRRMIRARQRQLLGQTASTLSLSDIH